MELQRESNEQESRTLQKTSENETETRILISNFLKKLNFIQVLQFNNLRAYGHI